MGESARYIDLEWLKQIDPDANVSSFHRELPTFICVSERPHKVAAIAYAMDGLQLPATIGHMPVSRFQEPYETKNTGHFIRQKSELSGQEFARDYPNVMALLGYIKEINVDLLAVDVRRKIGVPGDVLTEQHKPPEGEYSEKTIADYIHRRFARYGKHPVVERIETGYDIVRFGSGKHGHKIHMSHPAHPVVSGIYLNWVNPLSKREDANNYVLLTRYEKGNAHNKHNMSAPEGVLNEWLILYALLSGTLVDVTYHPNLKRRLEHTHTKKALESLYTPGFIALLEDRIGPIERGSKQDWWRNVLLASTSLVDHSKGGPWDAVDALMGQYLSNLDFCDDAAAIDIKSSKHSIAIDPVRDVFDTSLLPRS